MVRPLLVAWAAQQSGHWCWLAQRGHWLLVSRQRIILVAVQKAPLRVDDMNLAVFISGNGSNLQAIIDTLGADSIGIVISNNPDVFGLLRAKVCQIKNCVVDHRLYDSRETFGQALHEALKDVNPDYIILAGFMRILDETFVKQYENRILNIHPSLLPKFKGLNTYQRALDDGEYEHGVSVHVVIPELDGGTVLMQGSYYLEDGETAKDHRTKGLALEHKMYPEVIRLLYEGKIIINDKTKPIQFKDD